MKYLVSIIGIFCVVWCLQAQAAESKVVVSIKPLHSLVAAVMEGDDAPPALLVGGSVSPHAFALKPSQARLLQHADIVFYMGDTFEQFLTKTFASLPPGVVRAPMEKTPGLTLY